MNNPNPLVPQGSKLEQNGKSRARARLAVFFICIFAVHVVGLMALLMAGCKREQPVAEAPDTNAVLPTFESTNVLADTNVLAPPTGLVPPPPPVPTPIVPQPEPVGGPREYVVAKGESFYSIGKKMGVSMKAIQEANPGVDSSRLKIGQKLLIPAASAPTPAGQIAPEAAMGGEEVYVVKSGDTLTKIASAHGTTVRALRAANGLRTDNIKVGQKLKLPAKASVSSAPVVPAAPPIPAMSAEPVPLPTAPVPASPTPPSP